MKGKEALEKFETLQRRRNYKWNLSGNGHHTILDAQKRRGVIGSS
jgi:hypothetical protein